MHDADVLRLVVAAIAVAIAELPRARIVDGAPSTLGIAPALGIAIVVGDPVVGIAAAAIGASIATVIRREPRVPVPTILLVGVATVVYRFASFGPELATTDRRAHLSIAGIAIAVTATIVADAALRASTSPTTLRLREMVRALTPFHVAAASGASLFALSQPILGWVAYPLLLAPIGATQHAFTQLAQIRATFEQTVRALARVPELAGYSHAGHAQRVADLATDLATELGVASRTIEDLALAAQLHDIGRMRAPSPDRVPELPASEVAASGAAVVRATGALPRVADLIEQQHDPDAGLPAQILRIASAFDDLTATGDGGLSDTAALVRIAARDDVDPVVVSALARVLAVRAARTAA